MSRVPKRNFDVRYSKIAGKMVLVRQNRAYEINETAQEIWLLSDGNNSIEDIVMKLSPEYDISPAVFAANCVEVLGELEKLELLVVLDEASRP